MTNVFTDTFQRTSSAAADFTAAGWAQVHPSDATLNPATNTSTDRMSLLTGSDGAQYLKFRTHHTDVAPLTPTANPRTQLNTGDIMTSGNEYWIAFIVRYPGGVQPNNFLFPTDWNLQAQFFGSPYNGSPPWSLGVRSGTNRMIVSHYGYDVGTSWVGPVVAVDHMYQFLIRYQVAASGGYYEMWLDGVKQTFSNGTQRHTFNSLQPGGSAMQLILSNYGNAGSWTGYRAMDYRVASVKTTQVEAQAVLDAAVSGTTSLTLLFNGDLATSHTPQFEVATLPGDSYQTANGSRVKDVADPAGNAGSCISLRTNELDHDAANTIVRAQAVTPSFIDDGEYVTQVFAGYLPSSLPAPPQFFTIGSMYGPPFGGTGPRTIQVTGKPNGTTFTIGIQDNSSTQFFSTNVAADTWWKIAVRSLFSASGWVEVYFAGSLDQPFAVQTLSGGVTRRSYATKAAGVNDGGANSFRVNNYHRYPWSGVSGLTEWFVKYHRAYDGASALTATQYAAALNELAEYQGTVSTPQRPAPALPVQIGRAPGSLTFQMPPKPLQMGSADYWQVYVNDQVVELALDPATTSYTLTTAQWPTLTDGIPVNIRVSYGHGAG